MHLTQIPKLIKKFFTTSTLGLLASSNFQPLLHQDQVVLNIVLLILLIPLIILIVACLTYWMYALEQVNTGLAAFLLKFLEYTLPLTISYVGFDLIKEFISMAINNLCQIKFLAGKKTIQNELEKYSDDRIKSIYDRKYLSYVIYKRAGNSAYETTGAFSLGDVDFEEISENLKRERLSNSGKLEKKLEDIFLQEIYKRNARWEIVNLPDKFWKSVSLSVSMSALGIGYTERLSMNSSPNSILWRDIYVYFKAWLVCSIDNDIDISMSVKTIGLNYPDKDNPDKDAYKRALGYFLIDIANPEIAQKSLRIDYSRERIRESVEKLLYLIDTEY